MTTYVFGQRFALDAAISLLRKIRQDEDIYEDGSNGVTLEFEDIEDAYTIFCFEDLTLPQEMCILGFHLDDLEDTDEVNASDYDLDILQQIFERLAKKYKFTATPRMLKVHTYT